MKLASVRSLEELKEVLRDPAEDEPDPVYWVFSGVGDSKWENLTIIAPGKSQDGDEFPKTYGHYHPMDASNETYHLLSGEGILLMQKKFMENGRWVENKVEEVCLIKMKPGDEVVIKPQWGHSWSNSGIMPLLSFDDWKSGHTPDDYKVIESLRGMAYYLIRENSEVEVSPNPNYNNLPLPVWMSADEFKSHIGFE